MKKVIYMITILILTGFLAGCGKVEIESNTESTNTESTFDQSEEFISAENSEEDDIELKDTIEVDFTYDYTEDIKADVN